MLKLSEREFSRLSPEDKLDYLAEHGRHFVEPTDTPTSINPSAQSWLSAEQIAEREAWAKSHAEQARRAQEQSLRDQALDSLRQNSHYPAFRQLLDTVYGLSLALAIFTIFADIFISSTDFHFPVFYSICFALWILLCSTLARSIGHLLADLADQNFRK